MMLILFFCNCCFSITVSFDFTIRMLQAKSRILPTDVVLPLNVTANRGPVETTNSDLTSWRQYITKARELQHSLDESMQKAS